MMQVIRDKAQGIVAWVIVGIVAFVLCFWGVSGSMGFGKPAVLAKINGKQVTAAEVDNIYNRWLRVSSSQKDFDINQIDPIAIKKQITVGIAQQIATVLSLEKGGMTVSDSMVVEAIRSKAEFQKDSKFSIDAYKLFLQQMGVNEAEFEAMIREQILINQLQLGVLASSFATPAETERLLGLRNQTRDFGYTIISAEKFQKSAAITNEAIEEFYNTHKQQFMVPEKVQVEYIELSLDDLMRQIPVDDQKLRAYYKANEHSFIEPRTQHLRHIMILAPEISDAARSGSAEKQINDIYAQLQNGAKFTDLVKKYSEDKASVPQNGDIGWAGANDNLPAPVFELQKNGDFTAPIKMEYGWHIFQLVETKGGKAQNFESVKDSLVSRYKRDTAERLFSTKGDELANITFENPTSLAIASERLQLPIKTSDFFTKQGGEGIAQSANVLKAAFSEDVYAQNHNSELVRISDDAYVVLRLKEKQPEHEQPLSVARVEIESYLKRLHARDEAQRMGDELLSEIKQTNNPNKAASNKRLEWKVSKGISRDSKALNSDLLQRVFVMTRPQADSAFNVAGFSLPNGDYAVVALTKVKDGIVEDSSDSNLLETMGRQIAHAEGQLDYAAIQEALIEQAKIKYY